mgnify:CR=1 FL=1
MARKRAATQQWKVLAIALVGVVVLVGAVYAFMSYQQNKPGTPVRDLEVAVAEADYRQAHPLLKKAEAAETFISWATSKAYLDLVAQKEGWANVPPGTRTSLYENSEYTSAAPFAAATLQAINNADPSITPDKPYVGLQFAAIPEFQGLGTAVGQQFSAALAG